MKLFSISYSYNSDNASYFTSKMFEEILTRLGSCPVFSTPYSHTASGVERLNNTLEKMRRANDDNWTELLQAVVFLYNTSVHSSTGFCPAELLFGFIPRLPIKSDLDLPIHRPSAAETFFAQEQNRKKYNAIHKEILFPLKSRVMVSFPNLGTVGNSRVCRPFYKGPYKVLERVGNVNYRVRSLTTPYKIILVHCKRLRHCRQRLDHLVTPDSSHIPSLPNSATADLQPLRRSRRIADRLQVK
jgi:hypothetical protein